MRKKTIKDNMRRLILILAMTSLLVSLFAPFVSAVEASGTCGENLNWKLSESGTLTISGNGSMSNYSELKPAPWAEFHEDIRAVIIKEGVTTVGKRAFYGLENLVSVVIPSTVKTIGKYAFMECRNLKMLSLADGVETIRESAFENCASLSDLRLPKTVKTIEYKAFYRCDSLKLLTIPESVTTLESKVFAYCSGLLNVTVNANIEKLPLWTFYGCKNLKGASISETILSIDSGAFGNCESFAVINYSGTQDNGEKILTDIAESNEKDISEYTLNLSLNDVYKAESSESYMTDKHYVLDTTVVEKTENSIISTTHSKLTEYTVKDEIYNWGTSHVEFSLEVIIENNEGWNELLTSLKASENKNQNLYKIYVYVSLKGDAQIQTDILNQLANKNVYLTIDMQDGSTVKIDCKRLEKTENEKQNETTALSYQLSQNPNPTKQQIKTIGDAQSYLLSFDGSLEMDFSPKIYLGKTHSYKTATLYQYIPGRGLSLLQSVIVDKSGYATYYLGSTKDTTQYLIALDVKGVDSSTAIIPEDIAKDYGEVIYYEPIEYVVTGVRMFMGLSLFQFTIAVFCGMLVLFVGVGILMSIIYRKKKMEAYYQMLKNAEDDGFI